MITSYDIDTVIYFIERKGDIERWCSWEEKKDALLKEFPILKEAFDQQKKSEQMMSAALLYLSNASRDLEDSQ